MYQRSLKSLSLKEDASKSQRRMVCLLWCCYSTVFEQPSRERFQKKRLWVKTGTYCLPWSNADSGEYQRKIHPRAPKLINHQYLRKYCLKTLCYNPQCLQFVTTWNFLGHTGRPRHESIWFLMWHLWQCETYCKRCWCDRNDLISCHLAAGSDKTSGRYFYWVGQNIWDKTECTFSCLRCHGNQ